MADRVAEATAGPLEQDRDHEIAGDEQCGRVNGIAAQAIGYGRQGHGNEGGPQGSLRAREQESREKNGVHGRVTSRSVRTVSLAPTLRRHRSWRAKRAE